ncbi:MAG: metallophosphoesterase family protein [Pseudomonadota bacterium]
MKLAILSDVHANLVALDAVLRELEPEGVDAIACLGDMIQGGPQPAQTVARLRDLGCPVVMGNSDAWLLSGRMTGTETLSDEQQARLEQGRQWSLAELSAADRDYIAGFSPTIEVALAEGLSLLGFHGSPADFDQFIFPTTPEPEFQALLSPHAHCILAGGHIHLQFVRRVRDLFFFNPGSVGVAYHHEQAAPGLRLDPWAEYAILTLRGRRIGLEFRRTPFDVNRLLQVYRSCGCPFPERALQHYGTGTPSRASSKPAAACSA